MTFLGIRLEDWQSIATIAGTLLGIVALLYTGRQIKLGTRSSRAQFWLELRKQFQEHRDIHEKLSKRLWSKTDGFSDDDRLELQSYMGLLEHCEAMMQDRLLDVKTFYEIYGYRIRILLDNPVVVRDVLIIRRKGWKALARLIARMRSETLREPGEDSERDRHLRGFRKTYLCGFRKTKDDPWTLWSGHPDLETSSRTFESWEALQAAYEERRQELQASAAPPDFAWLLQDGAVIHEFPARKVAAPPAMVGLPDAGEADDADPDVPG